MPPKLEVSIVRKAYEYCGNENKCKIVRKPVIGKKADNKFITSIYSSFARGTSPLPIVYKDPSKAELLKWLSSTEGYMEGLFSFDGVPFHLEDYQRRWVNDTSKYKWGGKSRRVGLSLIEAALKLARAMLRKTSYTVTFISYTLEEAINKIEYARTFYESMPTKWKRRRMRDRKQSIEFVDEANGVVTKLLSHAQRAPRGSGGSIVLDEMAHYQWAFKILEASLACILTGGGDLTLFSTPFGEGDPFHEVGTNLEKYPDYTRHWIYWWECTWLCNDTVKARKFAPKMSTEERVMRFGTKDLRDIFNNYVDIDSFRQEMECAFLSEAFKFYPMSLIRQIVYPYSSIFYCHDGLQVTFDPKAFDNTDDCGDSLVGKYVDKFGREQFGAYPLLLVHEASGINFFRYMELEGEDGLYRGIQMNRTNGDSLLLGYDVGRSSNSSYLKILEECPTKTDMILQVERYSEELENIPLPDQERYLVDIMNNLRGAKLAIDSGGLGMDISERLYMMFPGRVTMIQFDANWKSDSCKNLKNRMQKYAIALAEDKKTIEHIASIRKKISANRMAELFAADEAEARKQKHHGDAFWALNMASSIGTSIEDVGGAEFNLGEMVDGPRLIKECSFGSINDMLKDMISGPSVAMSPIMDNSFYNSLGQLGDMGIIPNFKKLPKPNFGV